MREPARDPTSTVRCLPSGVSRPWSACTGAWIRCWTSPAHNTSMALAAILISAIVGAGVIYQWIGAARDTRRFPPPGRLVDVGRGRLHISIAAPQPDLRQAQVAPSLSRGGAAYVLPGTPTVVFDAGISASSLSWLKV